MVDKNNHNIQSGSNINRSNERINSTGEVFTLMELCAEMRKLLSHHEQDY